MALSRTFTSVKPVSIEECRRIDCEQMLSRINQHLIAGRFGHEGLRQLRTKVKDTQCETYLYS